MLDLRPIGALGELRPEIGKECNFAGHAGRPGFVKKTPGGSTVPGVNQVEHLSPQGGRGTLLLPGFVGPDYLDFLVQFCLDTAGLRIKSSASRYPPAAKRRIISGAGDSAKLVRQ